MKRTLGLVLGGLFMIAGLVGCDDPSGGGGGQEPAPPPQSQPMQ